MLDQVWMCVNFMRKYVPGFENAVFSGIAPRIGIRETRRIVGEYVLTRDDVMQARKRDDGIGKGAHELDVHGSGAKHVRSTIKDGGSYDIPFGCLVPKNVPNMLVAGRCLSATREAHSSARVMGTCMAMGQAAGTAAAMCAADPKWKGDVRSIDLPICGHRSWRRERCWTGPSSSGAGHRGPYRARLWVFALRRPASMWPLLPHKCAHRPFDYETATGGLGSIASRRRLGVRLFGCGSPKPLAVIPRRLLPSSSTLFDGFSEQRLTKYNGQLARKAPAAGAGRQRLLVAFRCSRSAACLNPLVGATRERPQSPGGDSPA